MIVVMNHAASLKQIGDVIHILEEWKIDYHVSKGEERTVIGLLGQTSHISREALLDFPGGRGDSHHQPYKMASRDPYQKIHWFALMAIKSARLAAFCDCLSMFRGIREHVLKSPNL
jgi:hypothetical protein